MFDCSVFVNRGRLAARAQAPGMGAVMRRRRAAGLPRRRGDQWGATSATFAGQERAAGAFERTARRRRVRKRISARALRRPEAESVAPPRRQRRRADGRRPSASGIRPTAAPRTQAPGRPEKIKTQSSWANSSIKRTISSPIRSWASTVEAPMWGESESLGCISN